MRSKGLISGLNAHRNYPMQKQRTLDLVDRFSRPIQLQNTAPMTPSRESLLISHGARQARSSDLELRYRSNHSSGNRGVGLGIDQDESAGRTILSIEIESHWPQQSNTHHADSIHLQRLRGFARKRADVGAMFDR